MMTINVAAGAKLAGLLGPRCYPFSFLVRLTRNISGILAESTGVRSWTSCGYYKTIDRTHPVSQTTFSPFSTSSRLLRLLRTKHSRHTKPSKLTTAYESKGNIGEQNGQDHDDPIYGRRSNVGEHYEDEKNNVYFTGKGGSVSNHQISSKYVDTESLEQDQSFYGSTSLNMDQSFYGNLGDSNQRNRKKMQTWPSEKSREHLHVSQWKHYEEKGNTSKERPSGRKEAHMHNKYVGSSGKRNSYEKQYVYQFSSQRQPFPTRDTIHEDFFHDQHNAKRKKTPKLSGSKTRSLLQKEEDFYDRTESRMVYSPDDNTVSADLMEMGERWKRKPKSPKENLPYHKKEKRRDREMLKVADGNDLLFGISPCLLALRHSRRLVHQVYTIPAFQKSKRPEVQEIKALLEEQNLRVAQTNRKVLALLSGHSLHQGICMETSRLRYEPVSETSDVSSTTGSVRLVLDQIRDPMNLGALLRSAYFLGVDKVITSKINCCSLTPSVSKASSGVMEVMPVYSAGDIPSFLEREKEMGWNIVGACSTSGSQTKGTSIDERQVTPCQDYTLSGSTLLVIGNEGFGLKEDVRNLCSEFITIPPGRQLHDGIDSLNVSVAAGILLHSLLGKKAHSGPE